MQTVKFLLVTALSAILIACSSKPPTPPQKVGYLKAHISQAQLNNLL